MRTDSSLAARAADEDAAASEEAIQVSGLDGRTAIVTGAGAGLGRAEALALAAAGAAVVVNDLSESVREVAAEIEEAGGKALAVTGDIAERATADTVLGVAVEHFGGLDVLVNNAGVLRDKMLFGLSDEDWDLVLRVHLRGHFLLSRGAAAHWRQKSKVDGKPCGGSVVNTASEAFLLGPPGQANYAAAKAGIVALTMSTARGLARYGVRANAICPRARTAMTEAVFGAAPEEGVDPLSPDHVAPLVAYLASDAANRVNGQVFVVHGGMVALLSPPTIAQRFDTEGPLWTQSELDNRLGGYFADRDPERFFVTDEVLRLP